MTNVIKQRQLKNNDKLTPKINFIYAGLFPNYQLMEKHNIKLNNPYYVNNQSPRIFSVGKGECIGFNQWSSNDEFSINLINKKTGTILKSLRIDSLLRAKGYRETNDIVTFIGKPFPDSNDRYIALCYYNELNGSNPYSMSILNIDTWRLAVGPSGPGIWSEPTYDGVDTIYFRYTSNSVYALNIKTMSGSYIDSLVATKIFGINELFIIYADANSILAKYELKTKTQTLAAAINHAVVGSCKNSDGSIEPLLLFSYKGCGSFWVDGKWVGGEIYINIFQSLVDGCVVGPTEYDSFPAAILDYTKKANGDFDMSFIIVRPNGYGTNLAACALVRTTNTNGIVISHIIGTWMDINLTGNRNKELLKISFNNVTSLYGIGNFYNFGLQKQWDNNI